MGGYRKAFVMGGQGCPPGRGRGSKNKGLKLNVEKKNQGIEVKVF